MSSITNAYDSSINLNYLMDSIEKIQYQAALEVTGAWQSSSRNKLYEELGWESLSDRRYSRRLLLLYKIHNNISPRYLIDNMPPLRQVIFRNNNPHKYHVIPCNTMRYMNSFFPDSIKSWNNIGKFFHQINTIGSFKNYEASPSCAKIYLWCS